MYKIIFAALLSLLAMNTFAQKKCNAQEEDLKKAHAKVVLNGEYGKKISANGAVSVMQVEAEMKKENIGSKSNVKVTGKVLDVCQKKGCWMTIDKGNGEAQRIRFKDYAFFMPKDLAGKTIYAQGKAYLDTTSVEMLKHYAEDAKRPQAEIDAITKPAIELGFEAFGVLIKK